MKIAMSIFLFCASLFANPIFSGKICDQNGNEFKLEITKIQMSGRGSFALYKKNQVTSNFDVYSSWGFLEDMTGSLNSNFIKAKVTEMRSNGLNEPYNNNEVKSILYPDSSGNGIVFNPMSQGTSLRVQLSHYYSTQYCR